MDSIFVGLSRLKKDIDAVRYSIRLGEWVRGHNFSMMDDGRSSEERNLYSRQFDYSATLSRLYFSYESFVYSCIREWLVFALANEGAILDFSSEKFFNDYLDCCGQLISRISEQRFSHIAKNSVVESLYGVLKKDRSVSVIIEALVADLPNLREKTIGSICQRVQVVNVGKWFAGRTDLSESCVDYIGSASVESALNDFVERRNSISHGRFQNDDIYGANVLLRLCSFIEMLCGTLAECISFNWLSRGSRVVTLGVVESKYRDPSTCLIEARAEMFDVGRNVYIRRESASRCYPATIEQIQLEGASVIGATTNAGDLIGMKLSVPVQKKAEILRIMGTRLPSRS